MFNKYFLFGIILLLFSCDKETNKTYIFLGDYPEVVDKNRGAITTELTRFKNATTIGIDFTCKMELRSIDTGAFEGLEKIKVISLLDNRFDDKSNLEEINNCQNVEIIYFTQNKLKKIPDWNLPNLQLLGLSDNSIQELSVGSYYFERLRNLGLRSNKLESLPDSLPNMPLLDTLYLDDNLISAFPSHMNYPKLKVLSVGGNKIVSFKNLMGCPLLQDLSCDKMALQEFPMDILGLKNLTSINFSENEIKNIPDSIIALTRLKSLYLFGNLLNKLPENFTGLEKLEYLYLSANKFENFPKQLLEMKQLKLITFENNPVKLSDLKKEAIKKALPATEIRF